MRSNRWTSLLIGGAGFVAIWAYVRLFADTFVDDAFISLKYSGMLATNGTWSFLGDRVSNTATSPLNVIVTALASMVVQPMTEAVVVVTTIQFGAMWFLLRRISRTIFDHAYFGWFAFIALVTNCLLVSTLGLEGSLFTVLLVWSLDLFLRRRWNALAAVLGLVVLARPDGALLFLIYAAVLPRDRRVLLRYAAVYLLTIAPWFLYSWIHLGSFVPDTLQIKVGQAGWGRDLSLFSGVAFYVRRYPLEAVAAGALLPAAAFAWRSSRPGVRPVASVLGLYAVLHMAAYSAAKIPPYHWYYVNQVTPIVLLGSLAIVSAVDAAWKAGRWRLALGGLALVPALGLGAVMLKEGLPLREAPIHTNWGTHARYREIGLWIQQNIPQGRVVFNQSEMGTVSYYSQRTIVNEFSDPNMTYGAILERYPSLPWVVQRAIDVNFYWRELDTPLPERSYILIHHLWPNDEHDLILDRQVMSWDTSTSWVPSGRLYLLRPPGKGTPK